jgi:hypothetical protein
MSIQRRSVDPESEFIDVFTDESHEDYLYLKKLAETTGKTLRFLKRQQTPPANAIVVTKAAIRNNHQEYLRLKAQAEREHRPLWFAEEEE